MRIARWLVPLALGCRGGGAPPAPAYPPLAEPAAGVPVAELADELVPLPAEDPAHDPGLGRPPASSPRGVPIVITLRPPQVGDVRERELRMRNVIDFEYEGRKHRQLSSNRYVLREELSRIEGETLVFAVTAIHATEAMLLKDKPHTVTTAQGDYVITVTGPGKPAAVARPDGSAVDNREVEELGDLFGFDSARPHPFAQIVSQRALSVGESVELTRDENIVFGAGREVTAPIHVTLLEATATTARYQADVVLRFPSDGAHERRLRYWATFERVTGRLLELHELMTTIETSDKSREHHVQHLAMRLRYAAR